MEDGMELIVYAYSKYKGDDDSVSQMLPKSPMLQGFIFFHHNQTSQGVECWIIKS